MGEPNQNPKFSVNELFGPTLQGEGPLAGAKTLFIRFNGCDYRCSFCDSLDAVLPERILKHNQILTLQELLARCKELSPNGGMVTLSGGNPALQKHGGKLAHELNRCGFEVAIETQGSFCPTWLNRVQHVILSPKPPSSGMETNWDTLDACVLRCVNGYPNPRTALKVVVFNETDYGYAKSVFNRYRLYREIPNYIQVGTIGKGFMNLENDPGAFPTAEELLADYRDLAQRVLDDPSLAHVRVLPQLHLYLFGHGRGV